MKEYLFFVDAETDGLYGSFLSVAVIVTDCECRELERHYWGIAPQNLPVHNQWVIENVLPVMGEYEECWNEAELLENVWQIWEKYYDNAYAVADVCFPVETRLFETCIRQNLGERMYKGPFPFLDLSSLLYAKGENPLVEYEKLLGEEVGAKHNALTDVEMLLRIWKNIKTRRENHGRGNGGL